MAHRRLAVLISLLCLISLGLCSCLARNRVFARLGGKPTQTLLLADRATLVNTISKQYEAMLVRPVDPQNEKLVMENFTDESEAFYILHLIRQNGDGQLQLERTVWFNRYDLRISRQMVFDPAGNILTDARYSGWRAYDNVAFPKHIEIN